MGDPFADNDTSLPIDRLDAFLAAHRPRLGDILATACELYRINPDWLCEDDDRAAPVREMFMYCAGKFCGHRYPHAGELVGVDPARASQLMGNFCKRLSRSNVLREDLSLVTVRLTECVLRQRRYL